MMKLVVLSCLLAAASAGLIAPLAYSAPYGYYGYGAPFAYSVSHLTPYNYRGPVSLAPGQPANILGADGRPLDTLDVNLDRSAHLTAKALDRGVHLLKKRSVASFITPLTYAAPYGYYGFGAPLTYSASLLAPNNYRGPLSLAPGQPANILGADGRPLDTLDVNLDRSAHLTAKALDRGVHLLKKRSVASFITPLTYAAPYGYYGFGAPFTYSASLLAPNNYRGPLSLAPGQPANILGADGRPLDTLDVNLDRSAHITAKAFNSGVHLLKKRSVVAPIVATPVARIATPLITPAVPLTYRSPYATTAYISPIPHAHSIYSHIY